MSKVRKTFDILRSNNEHFEGFLYAIIQTFHIQTAKMETVCNANIMQEYCKHKSFLAAWMLPLEFSFSLKFFTSFEHEPILPNICVCFMPNDYCAKRPYAIQLLCQTIIGGKC